MFCIQNRWVHVPLHMSYSFIHCRKLCVIWRIACGYQRDWSYCFELEFHKSFIKKFLHLRLAEKTFMVRLIYIYIYWSKATSMHQERSLLSMTYPFLTMKLPDLHYLFAFVCYIFFISVPTTWDDKVCPQRKDNKRRISSFHSDYKLFRSRKQLNQSVTPDAVCKIKLKRLVCSNTNQQQLRWFCSMLVC